MNTSLNTKQEALLRLLVESDRIMTENEIEYVLFGGSTLGACRHHGFIPWDDDIDIILDFENYYKLEKLFRDGPIGGVNLVFFNNEPNWYRPFAMFVKTDDTCYAVPSLYTNGKATGTRIDVMICDYVPKERLEDYRRDLMLYEESLMDVSLSDYELFDYKEEYYALKKRIMKEGKAKVEAELRKNLEAYSLLPNADQLVVRYWTRELRHYDKDDIFKAKLEWFEGHKMPVPANPEKQLREQYGYDWYIIPPAESWESHAFYNNDFISGNNYHEDLMQFIDQSIGEKSLIKLKRGKIEGAPYLEKENCFKKNLEAQRELMRSGIRNSDTIKRIMDSYTNERFSEVCKEMEGMMSCLGSFRFVEKEYKQINTEAMKAWIYSNIYCGRYYLVFKIATAFDTENEEEYSSAIVLARKTADLAAMIQDKDYIRMQEKLSDFTDEDKSKIPECIIAEIILALIDEENTSTQALINKCEDYLFGVPDNYDIIKKKGDLLFRAGNKEEAERMYDIVLKNSKNGLDLLALKENNRNA